MNIDSLIITTISMCAAVLLVGIIKIILIRHESNKEIENLTKNYENQLKNELEKKELLAKSERNLEKIKNQLFELQIKKVVEEEIKKQSNKNTKL